MKEDNCNGFLNKSIQLRDPSELAFSQAALAVARYIDYLLDQKKVSKAELARRLGVSRQSITSILNGNTNLTLKTIVRIAGALESEIDITFKKNGVDVFHGDKYFFTHQSKSKTPIAYNSFKEGTQYAESFAA